MREPSSAQLELARRLLAHENAAGDGSAAIAAGRVLDKLHAELDALLGAAGVQTLLVRSAQLTQARFPFLDASSVEDSNSLRECLLAQGPTGNAEAGAALFGTFFRLITTFIGERLTTQSLRNAWPTIETMGSKEKDE